VKQGRRIIFYSTVIVLLLSVFSLYARPDFLVMLANQVWGCF